jgi:hypothetical protein
MDRLLTPEQRTRLEARRAKWRKAGGKDGRDAKRATEACK